MATAVSIQQSKRLHPILDIETMKPFDALYRCETAYAESIAHGPRLTAPVVFWVWLNESLVRWATLNT